MYVNKSLSELSEVNVHTWVNLCSNIFKFFFNVFLLIDFLFLLIFLLHDWIRILPQEKIDWDIPVDTSLWWTLQVVNLTCKEPVEHCYRLASLIVTWDSDVDLLKRCIGVTECDDWAVSFSTLHDSLTVSSRVSDNYQSRFLEVFDSVISECTWDPVACVTWSFGVLTEFEDSALSLWALWHNEYVFLVLDACNDARD